MTYFEKANASDILFKYIFRKYFHYSKMNVFQSCTSIRTSELMWQIRNNSENSQDDWHFEIDVFFRSFEFSVL